MLKKICSYPLLGLLYLLSLLPLRVLYLLADLLYVLLYDIIRYRRKVVDENLLNAFPEKSAHERQLIAQKYFRHLADLIVETIKMLTVSDREVTKRVSVINADLVTNAFDHGKSVLGVLGHYGNWELNALRFSQLFKERRIIVYKPISNKIFDQTFLKMRSRFGATLIDMRNTVRKLAEFRNERTVTVLVADQTPARPDVQYFTKFLNQSTAVFLGVEKLAKLTDSVVIFCDVRRLKRGYYQCTFIPMFLEPKLTAAYEITQAHVRYLEDVIRQQPEYWLWSHRRWKFRPEEFQHLQTS